MTPNPASAVASPRCWLRLDIATTLASLLLLLAWDFSGLDLPAMRAVGSSAGFEWQHHWLTQRVAHDGGRLLAWLVLAVLLVNVWRPLWPGPTRAERVRWLVVTVVCVVVVPAIKQVSRSSCPWDLAEFDGVAQYVSHWTLGRGDGGPGRCFPSGHAAAAFAYFSGWFALRDEHPRAARAWLLAVLAVGTLFGVAQYVRGAHYPSHTLWTAWLCWTLCVVLMPRRRAAATIAP